jgi:hypothetical protein
MICATSSCNVFTATHRRSSRSKERCERDGRAVGQDRVTQLARGEQRADLRAKRRIAAAHVVEELRSPSWLHLERGIEHRLEHRPSLTRQ